MFTYAIFAVGMAVYLGALAVLAVAALASVVGSVSYPALVGLASTGLTITTVSTGILAAAGVMAGATMFGGAAITADYQGDHGNAGAGAAFGEAFKNGAAGAAANLVQSGANAGHACLTRNPVANNFGLAEVDLDADRDITETWTYGAGAKVNSPLGETEVAGNIKHNDEGWAGGEFGVNHKYEDPSGTVNGTVGGKVTWDENENVGGGFKAGVGHTPSGSQAEYEGNWNHEGDYSDKYKVNTPVYNTEGSWAEGPKDETPPWDK
jgi:hypothetical protein